MKNEKNAIGVEKERFLGKNNIKIRRRKGASRLLETAFRHIYMRSDGMRNRGIKRLRYALLNRRSFINNGFLSVFFI